MIVSLCKDANDAARFYELNPHLIGKAHCHINQPTKGYGVVANEYLDKGEILVFVHYDTVLTEIDLLIKAAEAGNLTGIIGMTLDGSYVWGKNITQPVEVSTLDACGLVIPVTSVRFDTFNFDSFHCCAEDFCLTWKKETGLPIYVYPSTTDHTGASFNDPKWWAAYRVYKNRLFRKWKGVNFATT